MAETTNSFDAAAYTGNGTRARARGAARGHVRRRREQAGAAPGGEGVSRQPAPGQRGHEDARQGDRRKPEAVEAEGNRTRASGLHSCAELGWWWYGVRSDPAQLCAVRAEAGARARAQERVQRSRPRRLRHRRRCVQLRCAQDLASRRLRRPPRRRRPEGSDSHRRREVEPAPLRPQPSDGARAAVLRRVGLPHPLVGCRGDRGQCDRADARADRRHGADATREGAEARGPGEARAREEEGRREEGGSEEGGEGAGEEEGAAKPAKKDAPTKKPAKKAAAKKTSAAKPKKKGK